MTPTTRIHIILKASALCGSLFVAACASTGPGDSASTFPFGKYHNGDTVAIFNADGTFVGTTTQGEDWVKGNYTVAGNEITMVDTWEGDVLLQKMGKSCMGVEGRYSWVLEGDVLTATAIDDACEGRKAGTDGTPWTRMP
jgi:hypothetical protein